MIQEISSSTSYFFYRLATVTHSLKTLYCLPREKVEAFLNSYTIFNHDWSQEGKLREEFGENYYQEVQKKLIDYYSVLNYLCAIGQVEKMYIPPIMDLKAGITKNQKLYEEKMSKDLMIQSGDSVLDIGCGRGRIASHIASITGAHVSGINIDRNQIDSAQRFVKGKKINKQCTFQLYDFNQSPSLPFKENTFDYAYEIQAFSYAKNLSALVKDIHRVLKPGGKIACLDWVRLDGFCSDNEEHIQLMNQVKPLIGAIGTLSVEELENIFKKNGFQIILSQNASINGLQAPLIENADKFFKRVIKLIHLLVRYKVIPHHFKVLFDRLSQDGQAFIEADKKRLVTTSHYILAQKI